MLINDQFRLSASCPVQSLLTSVFQPTDCRFDLHQRSYIPVCASATAPPSFVPPVAHSSHSTWSVTRVTSGPSTSSASSAPQTAVSRCSTLRSSRAPLAGMHAICVGLGGNVCVSLAVNQMPVAWTGGAWRRSRNDAFIGSGSVRNK